MSDTKRHIGELEQAVLDSIAGLSEPPPEAYAAAIRLARMYAFNIDEAVDTDTETATRALYLGPHLVNILRPLGLFPADGASEKAASGPGAQSRADVLALMEEYERRNGTEG